MYSPVKSSRVVPQNLQKTDIPAVKSALQPVSSPQKSSNQGMTSVCSPQKSSAAFPSSPQKAGPSSTSVLQSPLKTQALSRNLVTASPEKPELRAKPVSVPTVSQEKPTAGTPGESCRRSFLILLHLFGSDDTNFLMQKW